METIDMYCENCGERATEHYGSYAPLAYLCEQCGNIPIAELYANFNAATGERAPQQS